MKANPRVMVLLESARAYERALLRGVARYAHLHGPWVFVREAPFWERRSGAALLAQAEAADGVILREGPFLSEILKLGKPTIVTNYATERIPGLPNIVSDHYAIGRMAADHLIERGFRQFGFCGYGGFYWSRQRCDGFRERIENAGYRLHVYEGSLARCGAAWRKEQRLIMKWLQALPKPIGVMACIDERSQQVADACTSAGIAIPGEVAIVGVDNDDMICTLSSIPLSSVVIDAEKGGYEAARCLDMLMRGRKVRAPVIEIKPSHVIARTSTDIMAAGDVNVSRAARYIGSHCRETIYVSDVARAAGLSRRVLEKRFRSALCRSVNDYIRQCRVARITELLAGSAMTVSEIASHMGFPDAAHIARYFRRQTNTSPAGYRRNHCA